MAKSIWDDEGAQPSTGGSTPTQRGPRSIWDDDLSAQPIEEAGWGALLKRGKRGFDNTVNASKVAYAAETDGPDPVAELVAENQKGALPATAVQQRIAKEIAPLQKEYADSSGLGAVAAFAKLVGKLTTNFVTEPTETAGMIAENLPNSVPGIAGSIVGGMGGAATPIPGAALAGSIAGGFLGGYAIEQGSSLGDQIVKEARARGLDPTDAEALKPMVREKWDEFLKASRLKGVGTAGTDAALNRLTLGLAGAAGRQIAKEVGAVTASVKSGAISAAEGAAQVAKLEGKQAARNTLGRKVARGAAVTGAEMVGEGASEAAGQKLAYGEVDPVDVINESLMGLGQGAVMGVAHDALGKVMGAGSHDEAGKAIEAAKETIKGRAGTPPLTASPEGQRRVANAFAEVAGDETIVGDQPTDQGIIAALLQDMAPDERAQAIERLSGGDAGLRSKLEKAVADPELVRRGRMLDESDPDAAMYVNELSEAMRSSAGLLEDDPATQGVHQPSSTQVAAQVAPQMPATNSAGFQSEDPQQLQAQIDAAKQGRIPSVVVGLEDLPHLDVNDMEVGIAEGPDGRQAAVIATSRDVVQQAVTRATEIGLDEAMGEAKGYANPTLTSQPQPAAIIQQVDNTSGEVLHEEAVTPGDVPRMRRVEGTTHRVLPVTQAIDERLARFKRNSYSEMLLGKEPEAPRVVLPKGAAVTKNSSALVAAMNKGVDPNSAQAIDERSVVEVDPSADRELGQLVRAVRDAFGTRLVLIHTPHKGGAILRKDGSVFSEGIAGVSAGGKVYLNVKSASPLNTLGHELAHVLKTKHPDIYAKLEFTVIARARHARVLQLKQSLEKARAQEGNASDSLAAELREEMVAETIGEMAQDQGFWNDLFSRIGQDKQQAKTLYETIIGMLRDLARALTRQGYITGVRDMQAVRKATTEAYLEWSRRVDGEQKAAVAAAEQQAQAEIDAKAQALAAVHGAKVESAKASPFADRIQAIADGFTAIGEEKYGKALVMAMGEEQGRGQLTEEKVAFRENALRKMTANAAKEGKPPERVEPKKWTPDNLSGKDTAIEALPVAIREAAAKVMNEIGAQLGELGFKEGLEVNTSSPQPAQQLKGKAGEVFTALALLVGQRYASMRAAKTFKPEKLERNEKFATETLGIDTKAHPGVKMDRRIGTGGEYLEDAKPQAKAPVVAKPTVEEREAAEVERAAKVAAEKQAATQEPDIPEDALDDEEYIEEPGLNYSRVRAAVDGETEISTQNPQGVKRVYDPLTDMLSIDHAAVEEAMAANPKIREKVIDAILGYGFIAKDTPRDKAIETFKKNIVSNLLYLYDRVPADIRNRSKLWYDGANKIASQMATKYGVKMEQVAATMAAMSPQKDWFQNVSMAERALDILTKQGKTAWTQDMLTYLKSYVEETSDRAERETRQDAYDRAVQVMKAGTTLEKMSEKDAAVFIRSFDEAFHSRQYNIVTPEGGFGGLVTNNDGTPSTMMWSTFDPIAKSVSIFRDGSRKNISEQLGEEHKIRSFYNNIASPNSRISHVTIDTHAVAAGLFEALAGTDAPVTHNFGGTGKSDLFGVGGTYGIIADAYRTAAAVRGVQAREMQSITWEAVRGLFGEEIKSSIKPKVQAIWGQYRNGKLTFEQARDKIIELAAGVNKVEGGIKSPDWVGSDAGTYVEAGGASYEKSFVPEGGVRLREATEVRDRASVNLTVNTGSIPGLKELYERSMAGDAKATEVLQKVAESSLRFLLSGTSAKIVASPVSGVYMSDREPSIGVTVSFSESDAKAVMAGLARFAQMYNQQQVHVRLETSRKLGHEFGDGSYATAVYELPLAKELSSQDIAGIIEQTGLIAFSVTPESLVAYWVKPTDGEDHDASFRAFKERVTRVHGLVGQGSGKPRRSAGRLYVYGDGPGARIGYGAIAGDVRPKAETDGKTAKLIADYLTGQAVRPVKQKPLSAAVVKAQERLAAVFQALPTNNLRNPLVKKAYRALAQEVVRQYKALPVKALLDPNGYGSSHEMRRDVSLNNTLRVYPTTRETFGPPGSNFKDHPLLLPAGVTDASGKPMLFNDVLRAVHDYFAHNLSEVQFGPAGEYAAWKNHMSMTLDPLARWALTAETRAQNAWQNFRPGQEGKSLADRGYADQKAALPPIDFVLTGDEQVDAPVMALIKQYEAEGKAAQLRGSLKEGAKGFDKKPLKDSAVEIAPGGKVVRFQRAPAPDSPAFKAWFRDSKIVNLDGSPRVMFHGTARDITTFQPKQANAIFLTGSASFAEGFANSSAYWVAKNLRKALSPQQIEDARARTVERINAQYPDDVIIRERLLRELEDGLAGGKELQGEVGDYFAEAAHRYMGEAENIMPLYVSAQNPFDYENPEHIAALRATELGQLLFDEEVPHIEAGSWRIIEAPQTQQAIKQAGFDGFWVNEGGVKNLAVYKSEQIKSATGNAGTYDGSNPDIRFQRAATSAAWTEKRVDDLLNNYAYTQSGARTKAYAAWVSPEDFLAATTPANERERLEGEKAALDMQKLASERQELFLTGERDGRTFKLRGHEGRHRMMALRDAGLTSVPVVFRTGSGHDAFERGATFVTPQKYEHASGDKGFLADKLVPISYDNRKQLIEEFGQGSVRFQRVWHGTPHRGIEQFSTDKVGTGEGNQSYGWGLYFAGRREVAEHYRKKLSGDGYGIVKIDGQPQHGDPEFGDMMVLEVDDRPATTLTGKAGYDFMRAELTPWVTENENRPGQQARHAIDWLNEAEAAGKSIEVPGRNQKGQLYEVEIPEDDEMLLWDKPISEQPPKVFEALREVEAALEGAGVLEEYLDQLNAEWGEVTGNELVKKLLPRAHSDDAIYSLFDRDENNPARAVSLFLSAFGIKGTKYLDGASRKKEDGTYNYVIFDGENTKVEAAHYSRNATHLDSVEAVGTFLATGRFNYHLDDALARRQWGEAFRLAKDPAEVKRLMRKIGDYVIEVGADVLVPVTRWAESLPIADTIKQRLIGSMQRATSQRGALEHEVKEKFATPMFKAIGKAAKAHKLTTDQVKKLAGWWMTARYVEHANRHLIAKDRAALAAAQATGDPAAIAKAQQDLNDRLADVNGPAIPLMQKPTQPFKRGVAGGLSNATAKLWVQTIESQVDPVALAEIAAPIYKMMAWKKAMDVREGKVTQTMVNSWPNHAEYVPLTGDPRYNPDTDDVFSGGNALNQTGDFAMNGRTDSVSDDGIDAAFQATVKSVNFAAQQDFKRALHHAYVEASRLGLDIGLKRSPVTAVTRTSDDVVIYRDTTRNQLGHEWTQAWAYSFEDGRLPQALKRETTEHLATVLKPLSLPTRWYGYAVTQLMPLFAPINFVRDVWERSELLRTRTLYDAAGNKVDVSKAANASLGEIINPAVWRATVLKNFGSSTMTPERADLEELLRLGGVSTWGDYLSRTSSGLEDDIRRLGSNGVLGWKKPHRALGKGVHAWNNTFEMFAPLAMYRALKQQGMDPKDASAAVLDMMNFAKKGRATTNAKAVWVFVNPAAQSAHNLLRYLSTKTGWVRLSAYLLLGSALYFALAAAWGDDEDDPELGNKLDNLSNFTVERSIPVPLPGGHMLKVPVGFGPPQLAWALAGVLNRWKSGRYTGTDAALEAAKTWVKVVSPVAPSEMEVTQRPLEFMLQSMVPTVLRPLVSIGFDKTVMGAPLTPEFKNKKKMNYEQAQRRTAQEYSELAKFIYEATGKDVYPDQLKALTDGYLLGPLREIINLAIDNPARAERGEPARLSFLSQLVDNVPDRAILNSIYWRVRKDLEQDHREYESRKANGTLEGWETDQRRTNWEAYKKFSKKEGGLGKKRGEAYKLRQDDPEAAAERIQEIEARSDAAHRAVLVEYLGNK